jgi:predicted SnoaL-like aldol condensation-catalyzing enzyme
MNAYSHKEHFMSIEENKAIVRKHLIDVLEQGHVELIPSYYAPDGSVPTMDTPEQWKTRVLDHHRIAPGYKITILDMVAEGDKVAVLWQADLTYSVMPDPPPEKPSYPFGKLATWKIMNLFRIVDGKLVSNIAANEWGSMMINAGVYVLAKPEPA